MRIPGAVTTGALLVLAAMCARADTVWLRNGVVVHGQVVGRADGILTLRIGERTTVYRDSEVLKVEKNERTGVPDRETMAARMAERERELFERTGLNRDQRDLVKEVMWGLQSPDTSIARQAEERLIALGREMDLVRYFDYHLRSLSPRFVPGVLRVVAALDPRRATPMARRHVTSVDAESRETAILVYAALAGSKGLDTVARGAVDHDGRVRIAAAHGLAHIGDRSATPLLIANLEHPELRVRNASRDALAALWSSESRRVAFQTAREWTEFWEREASGVSSPLLPGAMEPLAEEGARFENE